VLEKDLCLPLLAPPERREALLLAVAPEPCSAGIGAGKARLCPAQASLFLINSTD
jgi:hypothetical protein